MGIYDFNFIEVLRFGWDEQKLLYQHEDDHQKSI